MNKHINPARFIFLLTGLLMMLTACQPARTSTIDGILQVTVSILPQAYFVERIGGEEFAVNVMVGPGEEAHTYEPRPEQMKALADSQVFFTIGVEYEENWIPRFREINPTMKVVNSAKGITRIEGSDDHSHENDSNEETHEDEGQFDGFDPHVWLSPKNGKIIAGNILNALIELVPDQEKTFQANYTTLIADIDSLNARIETTLTNLENQQFMVFHPSWGYFADQYNLEQIAVQIGGQDPSAREMAELVKIAQDNNIRVIFIQPSFSTSDAQAIAEEINAEIAIADPLARNWLENLESVAEAFAAAIRQ